MRRMMMTRRMRLLLAGLMLAACTAALLAASERGYGYTCSDGETYDPGTQKCCGGVPVSIYTACCDVPG